MTMCETALAYILSYSLCQCGMPYTEKKDMKFSNRNVISIIVTLQSIFM